MDNKKIKLLNPSGYSQTEAKTIDKKKVLIYFFVEVVLLLSKIVELV